VGPSWDSGGQRDRTEQSAGRISARSGEAGNRRAAFGPGLPADELPALESASRPRVRLCSGYLVCGRKGLL